MPLKSHREYKYLCLLNSHELKPTRCLFYIYQTTFNIMFAYEKNPTKLFSTKRRWAPVTSHRHSRYVWQQRHASCTPSTPSWDNAPLAREGRRPSRAASTHQDSSTVEHFTTKDRETLTAGSPLPRWRRTWIRSRWLPVKECIRFRVAVRIRGWTVLS